MFLALLPLLALIVARVTIDCIVRAYAL